jgi:hypothetical protein
LTDASGFQYWQQPANNLNYNMHSTNKHTNACVKTALTLAALFALAANPLAAGPYAGVAGSATSTAISKDSLEFVEWASSVASYTAGLNVSSGWQTYANALGKAQGTSTNILCLGDGGTVTLAFDNAIVDGTGYDFAVFENGFSNSYLELAYVEVSSDGINWVRFTNDSLTASAVSAYGSLDCTNLDGLAGTYIQGYGTPFDLSSLKGLAGSEYLDFNNIAFVRIVDIIGDGRCLDSSGDPIYDPYATSGSSNGFDLDAVGVINAVPEPSTYAALAGLAALGLVSLRRRNTRA